MDSTVNETFVKSILNKHKKRDRYFLDDYSVNPYSGCSFNCLYCYTKGSKYGEGRSKVLSAKVNAPEVLEKQLRRRAEKGEYGIIAMSTATEPYQGVEKHLKLTRRLLEIILKYRFPVHILTKSTLVLRDLELLKKVDKIAILPEDLREKFKRGVIVNFSMPTLNEKLAKVLEVGAPTPKERLEAMKRCKEAQLFAGVSYIPLLPYISDSEEKLDEMIRTAKDYGADFVFVGTLTLFGDKPTGSKMLYYRFLEKYYSELLPQYKNLFERSYQPPKKYRKNLEEKSKKLCKKYRIKNGII